MAAYAWLVPLLPLVAYVFLLVLGRKAPEGIVSFVSVALTFISFVVSFGILLSIGLTSAGNETYVFHWLTVGNDSFTVGFQVNHLNAFMMFVVTLVSTLVLLFSRGYMHKDERFPVYYQYMNLFIFSMLGLVISPNLLELYIFWEMVGLCSYLLIGFWYDKPEAAQAAKKSFIVTRIGDVGLFVGIILVFLASHSFDYDDVFHAAASGQLSLPWISGPHLVTLAAILIFLGAVGKSAQFPLHVWLPDAMEGPTPVSALIHAATMVAAGVYLVARTFPLFAASHAALATVAWIGGITALLAALIALTQRDIKRVIAYSTISQLGYMMMALGVGAYAYSMFHLMTHAFFKALLFLAAGSVIHALGTQDIFEMGGLRKKLPITSWTFLAGALSLAGIVPFAGFWSKDDILGVTLETGHVTLYVFGLIAAFCTAFYIFRVFFLTFTGKPKDAAKFAHAHEGGPAMTVPLVILGVLATVAGFCSTPMNGHLVERFLFADATSGNTIGVTVPENFGLMAVSVLVGLFGIGLAALLYWRPEEVAKTIPEAKPGAYPKAYSKAYPKVDAAKLARRLGPLYQLSFHKFYLDEIYYAIIVYTGKAIAGLIDVIDRFVIDGIVNLLARGAYIIGLGLKYTQTGQVQTYGVAAMLGVFVLLVIAMFHTGGVL
jgi:NADH-quinone oxidoreductase subunit L